VRLLVIAPFPPPPTGLSLASAALCGRLIQQHELAMVDYSKGSLKQGITGVRRLGEVALLLVEVVRKARRIDCVYLTLSQSVTGNLKDVLLLVTVTRVFRRKTVVHLHGAGLRMAVFDRHPALRVLNRRVYRRVQAAIVLGASLRSVFQGIIPTSRTHVVGNFADDGFFLDRDEIARKHHRVGSLIVVYLSNLIYGKGYLHVARALVDFSARHSQVRFAGVLAGHPEDADSVEKLKAIIQNSPNVSYAGPVSGETRFKLMKDADVFILPSFYSYQEGQPLSILEAYASGCIVLTTRHGGIPDVFSEPENGFFVAKRSSVDIVEKLEVILSMSPEERTAVGLRNHELASCNFRLDRYAADIARILEG
jgi:glycosyltransferase involved in cell wall biosynthesis